MRERGRDRYLNKEDERTPKRRCTPKRRSEERCCSGEDGRRSRPRTFARPSCLSSTTRHGNAVGHGERRRRGSSPMPHYPRNDNNDHSRLPGRGDVAPSSWTRLGQRSTGTMYDKDKEREREREAVVWWERGKKRAERYDECFRTRIPREMERTCEHAAHRLLCAHAVFFFFLSRTTHFRKERVAAAVAALSPPSSRQRLHDTHCTQ